MYKLMKRTLSIAAMICLLFSFTAHAEWEEPFGQSFAEHFRLISLSERIVIYSAATNDKLYAMTKSGTIYSYDVSMNQYSVVCEVPIWPSIDFDIPLNRQSAEKKKAMSDAVTNLFVDETNSLYAFNRMTGAVGRIDAAGVHWQSIRMDTSVFFEPGSDYASLEFNQPKIINNSLEGWTIQSMEEKPCVKWIAFSLIDGSCTTTDIEGAFQLCQLSDNELLALVLKDNQNIALEVYSKTGQYISQYDVALPPIRIEGKTTAIDLQNIVGPFAYDPSTASLYFIDNAHLYRSVDEKPFEIIDSNVPWMPPLAYSKIQTLNDKTVIVNGQWLWK